MKPYYQDEFITQYCGDSLSELSKLDSDSLDLLCTDPPYGISFMGKEWDKALPDIRVWKECLRVLKPGAFAFVMSIPRSDCLSRMIISLEDAGFNVGFSPIYWAYASGFPKASNVSKMVDKRLGVERKRVTGGMGTKGGNTYANEGGYIAGEELDKEAITPQAKALDGSYGGFQPKPAVEVIIVAMKPLSEKTFVDQALKNGKGITWLDDCRIPLEHGDDIVAKNPHTHRMNNRAYSDIYGEYQESSYTLPAGRFPANLIVSDDVLNDGRVSKSSGGSGEATWNRELSDNVYGHYEPTKRAGMGGYGDSGSFSRYFDLDKWWAKTFPFLIVPKASKPEKNKGLGAAVPRTKYGSTPRQNEAENKFPNNHPTVKPLKLMSYLITLGSREGDTILDPYSGSGTTLLSGQLLNRHAIGIDDKKNYCEIAAQRCSQQVLNLGA